MTDERAARLRLRSVVNGVLRHEVYGPRLGRIVAESGLRWGDVLEAVLSYTFDLHHLPNSFYDHPASRMALYVHTLVDRSYQRVRADLAADYLTRLLAAGATRIVDVGFGVPGRYLESLIRVPGVHVTLADRDNTAETFATMVLDCLGVDWQGRVSFARHDMDTDVLGVGYDVYMFMDSVEHARRPTDYLRGVVRRSAPDARFILALPIGRCDMEMHSIEWLDEASAERWLRSCGLAPERTDVVAPVTGIDLFAERIEGGFRDFLVLCRRTRGRLNRSRD